MLYCHLWNSFAEWLRTFYMVTEIFLFRFVFNRFIFFFKHIQGPFVAAFAQSNEGDVSPNTKGPHCMDSGKPCDILTSTCHGKVSMTIVLTAMKFSFEYMVSIWYQLYIETIKM